MDRDDVRGLEFVVLLCLDMQADRLAQLPQTRYFVEWQFVQDVLIQLMLVPREAYFFDPLPDLEVGRKTVFLRFYKGRSSLIHLRHGIRYHTLLPLFLLLLLGLELLVLLLLGRIRAENAI